MRTLTLATMVRFLKAAGVEKIEVFDPSNKSRRHELPVKNQADILYYSGHGSSENGGLLSCWDKSPVTVSDIAPSVNWKEDLDYFIIAGCAVLKPDATNGFAWGNATLKQGILKGLCGYHGSAPSDVSGKSVTIAQQFCNYLISQTPPDHTGTGNRVLNAWLEANLRNKADAIVYNFSSYWQIITQSWPLPDYIDGPHSWP